MTHVPPVRRRGPGTHVGAAGEENQTGKAVFRGPVFPLRSVSVHRLQRFVETDVGKEGDGAADLKRVSGREDRFGGRSSARAVGAGSTRIWQCVEEARGMTPGTLWKAMRSRRHGGGLALMTTRWEETVSRCGRRASGEGGPGALRGGMGDWGRRVEFEEESNKRSGGRRSLGTRRRRREDVQEFWL